MSKQPIPGLSRSGRGFAARKRVKVDSTPKAPGGTSHNSALGPRVPLSVFDFSPKKVKSPLSVPPAGGPIPFATLQTASESPPVNGLSTPSILSTPSRAPTPISSGQQTNSNPTVEPSIEEESDDEVEQPSTRHRVRPSYYVGMPIFMLVNVSALRTA